MSGAGSVRVRSIPAVRRDLSDGRRGEFVTEPCELVALTQPTCRQPS